MGADPATLTAIGTILGGTAAVYSATQIGKGDKPEAPTVAAPTVMPTPDDDAAKRAKMKQAQALQQRKGRQSTILSDNTNTDLLGG